MADEAPILKTAFTASLRLLAFGAGISAALTMATSRETAFFPFSSVAIRVDYTGVLCFRYFIAINSIACAYNFLLFFLNKKSLLWPLVVVADVLLVLLLTSINSVALGMAYMEKYGNSQAFWPPICDSVSVYCDHVMGAIASGFVEIGIFVLIVLYHLGILLNPLLVN